MISEHLGLMTGTRALIIARNTVLTRAILFENRTQALSKPIETLGIKGLSPLSILILRRVAM